MKVCTAHSRCKQRLAALATFRKAHHTCLQGNDFRLRADKAARTQSQLQKVVSEAKAVAVPFVEDALQPAADVFDRTIGKKWQAVPARWKLVGACSMAFMVCNMDKVNMSVAIIPMAQEFGWGPSTAGLVQSSFFWGYMLIQLPGGVLTNRIGGRRVLPAAVATWSAATALVPPLASTVPSLCVSRALVGLGEGAAPSSITDMIAKGVPPQERSRAVSFVFGGLHVGSILGLLAAPPLIAALGWEGVFYAFGALGLVWVAAYEGLLNDTRSEDMVQLNESLQPSRDAEGNVEVIPWRAFLRNGPTRALTFTHFCNNWFHYTMLAWLPSYFTDTLSLDLMHASSFALLPPLAGIAVSSVAGQLADRGIAAGWKVAHVRKACQITAFMVPSLCLVGAAATSGSNWSVAFISAALGINSFALAGLYCTHQDMSPKYASALLGLTNTAASVPGIVGIAVVGALLEKTESWSIALFAPIIILFLMGSVVYGVYGRSDVQDFDDDSRFAWEARLPFQLPGGTTPDASAVVITKTDAEKQNVDR